MTQVRFRRASHYFADLDGYSLRAGAIIAQAKLLLRIAAGGTKDRQLKSDANGIATQLDRLIKRYSATDREEQ
jgi:hypothetical protein